MPKVSCIIIFLNEERFLAEAIASVQAQTFTDWELLIVDDGSTDASVQIAQAHAAADPARIRYLTHPGRANRGKSASRNLGLHCARGERVAFLDGDDVWLPDKLERQLALFAANPGVQMVCGATLYWHSWNDAAEKADQLVYTGEASGARGLVQDRSYAPAETLAHFYPLGDGTTTSQSGYMIDRRSALAVGGFDESFAALFEDLLFVTKVLCTCHAFITAQCFDRYRQHQGSTLHTASRREWDRVKLRYLEWLQGYLSDMGIGDAPTLGRVRRLVLQYRYPRLFRVYRQFKRLAEPLRPSGAAAPA